MADTDLYADVTPHLKYHRYQGPTIEALKSALSAFNSTTYSAATLQSMTKQDMEYAARLNNLTVTDTSF